jgi:valyl-tRNA synthetase
MVTLYPVADRRYLDDEAEQQMALLMDVVTAVRNLRAEYNVPPGAQVEVVLRSADPGRRALLETHGAMVRELGKAGPLAVEPPSPSAPPMSVAKVLAEVEVLVLLGSVIDVQAERARLQKELGKLEGEIGFVEKKLGNQSFVERAPKDVVEKERLRLAELGERRARVQANLLRLQAAPRLANCRGGEA